jgi:regulator of RNase E activity RraA
MKKMLLITVGVCLGLLLLAADARGQINSLTRDELIKYTAQNPYERFPDGRPKVPDALLERLKAVSSSEELMQAGRGAPPAAGAQGPGRGGAAAGFVTYTDGWQILHPAKKLIGRAVTLQLMPRRPEVADVDAAEWKAKGNTVGLGHQSALDVLQPGDVIVISAGGGLEAGGIIGDNLAYYIWKKTGTGFVVDGAIRDLHGIAAFDMAGYYKGAVPPAIQGLMVTGINVPVRIGNATVMPGDVVWGDAEGVNFIPPQAVERLLESSLETRIHDEWTRLKFDTRQYKSTDIYGSPREAELIKEYKEYLKRRLAEEKAKGQ